MNTAILLVDSVTYAIKARRALSRIGISAVIKKVNAEGSLGCRYGVMIKQRYLFDTMAALTEWHIPFTQLRGGEQ